MYVSPVNIRLGAPLPEADLVADEDGVLTPLGERMVSDLARALLARFGDAPVRPEDAAKHEDIVVLTRRLTALRDVVLDVMTDPATRKEMAA